jgi:energy-coupling factor transporter ATP-binding protein EcfA2
MSQGMKQRLAIASVLALEPDVLFLDEPTALLDPEGTAQVWETIKQVGQGRTLVIVEHKIDEIVDFVDRVVLFNQDGEVLADDIPSRVFAEHKAELQQFGIWYPGVWADYTASPGYTAIHSRREEPAALGAEAEPGHAAAARLVREARRGGEKRDAYACAYAEGGPDLLSLRDFTGFHGRGSAREPKIGIAAADVAAGEWIAVVGPNGAGKSTLLQSIMQLIPTDGGYEFLGRRVKSFKDVAEGAAYVFQNPEMQFVTNSVYDEAAFGFRMDGAAAAEQLTDELLAEFKLQAQRSQHPFQLSLGQKRRLSVATAMSKRRPLVLLDEPTFGQDAANTFAILEKLESWRRQGVSIIMVTHDMEIVRYFATRVWLIEQGKLALDTAPETFLGTTASVASREGVLHAGY